MAATAHVRVDDRLIHGQVVVKWLRYLDCQDILVVDDELRGDDFMQTVLRMAAPAAVRVRVASVAEAVGLLEQPALSERGILVLLRTPQMALALLDHGVAFDEVNLGGLAGGPGATRLFRSVSASEPQLAALIALRSRGVRVYIQMVPEEHALELADALPAHLAKSRPTASPDVDLVRTQANGG